MCQFYNHRITHTDDIVAYKVVERRSTYTKEPPVEYISIFMEKPYVIGETYTEEGFPQYTTPPDSPLEIEKGFFHCFSKWSDAESFCNYANNKILNKRFVIIEVTLNNGPEETIYAGQWEMNHFLVDSYAGTKMTINKVKIGRAHV